MASRLRLRVLTRPRAPRRRILAAASLALCLACGGDGSGAERSAPELRDAIAVTSGPAALVAGWVVPGAELDAVIPAGADPRAWSPDDAELDAIITSRAVVTIGDETLEPWTQRVALPPSRTAELGAALPSGATIEVGTVTHTHGEGPAHSHGGTVATWWTDPDLWPALAAGVAEELRRAGVEDAEAPSGPELPWRAAEEAQRAALGELAVACGDRALIASDNGLEYVARAAGIDLRVALLEFDADGAPSQKGVLQLGEFTRRGDDAGLLVVFSDAEARAAEALAEEFEVRLHVFDLGLGYDPEASALARLTASTRRLAEALSEGR